ncbi:hypothetical protein DFH07DRAFT_766877 [Mycena maculata]|uniref:Uncharacterized protein n=1 Tax=Mycena maculata TaxID=230809 RepID=A0AAD7K315_9AGAR|nr:hypothetical protein DFH07DRAFT_766877 [Mycena maculata]
MPVRRPAQAPARLDPIPPRRWPRPPPPNETLKAMKFFFEDPANEEQWQAWVDKLVKIMWSDGEVIPWDDDKKIAAGVCLTADLEAGSDQPLSEEEVPRKVGRKAEKMREYRAWMAEFEEAELHKPTWKWPESSGQTSAAGWTTMVLNMYRTVQKLAMLRITNYFKVWHEGGEHIFMIVGQEELGDLVVFIGDGWGRACAGVAGGV